MPKRPLYLEIFAASLSAIFLEIAYTRIFSFKVFYYFTYLIIGMGLLGTGAGGVLVALSPKLREADPARTIPRFAAGGGIAVLAGYLLIAPIQLNVSQLFQRPAELGKVLLVSLVLTAPFLAIGIIVSSILSARPEAAHRLYGADLLGAAAGCAASIPLLKLLDPPRTVMLAGLLLTGAGLRLARGFAPLLLVNALAACALFLSLVVPKVLRDPVVAADKSFEVYRDSGAVRLSRWNPVFRIDVIDHPFFPGDVFFVYHDGQLGSGLRRFDGDLGKFASLEKDPRSLPFAVLPKGARVLVIGAAGGHEVLASLYFGASHVTGVELNAATLSLLTDTYADVTGHLGDNPRVTLVNGDGRSFLKQTDERYDLIWFVAPDSYAAMNASSSGAFVLSESYLYTVEMVEESLRHLASGGIVCTNFGEVNYVKKPNRTTRYLATARAAFHEEKIDDFDRHVLVASAVGLPPFLESVVVLGNEPFSPARVDDFSRQTSRIEGGIVRFLPGQSPDPSPVNQVIALPRELLPQWFQTRPYQVDPVRDDTPFFWHFVRFKDAVSVGLPFGKPIFDYEDAIAEQITLVFLAIAAALGVGLLLLPLFAARKLFSLIPHKGSSATYFAALGFGFMFFEVSLMQKWTLFLGYPTYALSVTLFAMLSSAGAGSMLATRYAPGPRALYGLLAALGCLVWAYRAALLPLIEHFIGSPLSVRALLTAVVIAPLGLCLGAFLPIGLQTLAALTPHRQAYLAWAWAVNGFSSVVGSILSTILAMTIGFDRLLLVALAIYAVGVLALARVKSVRTNGGLLPRAA